MNLGYEKAKAKLSIIHRENNNYWKQKIKTAIVNNPRYCKSCASLLKRNLKESLKDFKIRKYCGHNCANYKIGLAKIKANPRREDLTKSKQFGPPAPIKVWFYTKKQIYEISTRVCGRIRIRQLATKHYKSTYSTNLKCHICSYNFHIEICHIKSVSSFPDLSKLYEINHITNLIGLCPNHHTEFDKGRFCIIN